MKINGLDGTSNPAAKSGSPPDGVPTQGPRRRRGGSARLFAGLAVVFALAVALPVLIVRFAPLQDLTLHAAIADIVGRPWIHAADYVAAPGLRPYHGLYLLLASLSRFMPVVRAAQIVAAIDLIALPLGAMALAASLRRWGDARAASGAAGARARGGEGPETTAGRSAAAVSPGAPAWILLAAFPLVFTQSYYSGFLNYLLASALLLFGLAAWVATIGSPGRIAPPVATVLLGLCICLLHPLASALYAVGLVAIAVWESRVLLRRPVTAWVLLANAAIPVAAGWILMSGAGVGVTGGQSMDFRPPRTQIRYLLEPLLDLYRTPLRWVAPAGALLLLVGAILVVAGGTRRRDRAAGAAATLFAAMLALFFFLPNSTGDGTYYLNVRLNGLVYLTGVVALAVCVRPSGGRWAPACVAAGAALMIATAGDAHLRFDREARNAAPALAAIPPGAAVLQLPFDPRTAVLADRDWNNLYIHFLGYRHTEVGGYDPYLLPNPLAPARAVGAPRPAPDEFEPERFRLGEYAAWYDYILVRGEPRGRFAGELASGTREVAASGPWRLLAVVDSGGGP